MNCMGCGYSLVGLSQDGVCPECGLGVQQSVARRQARQESEASRVVQTAIITFLSGALLAHILHPRLRLWFGPTEYDSCVVQLGLLAVVLGICASIVSFYLRPMSLRTAAIALLTLGLLVPIWNEISITR